MGLGIHAIARIAAFSCDRYQEIGQLAADTSIAIELADRDALELRVLRQVAKPARRYRFTADLSKNVHGACLVLVPFDVVGDILFSAKHDAPDHKRFELVLGRVVRFETMRPCRGEYPESIQTPPRLVELRKARIETPAWVESEHYRPTVDLPNRRAGSVRERMKHDGTSSNDDS